MNDEQQLFQTVKANLQKTLQPGEKERTTQIIEETVFQVHEMTKHAQKLLKLFFLSKFKAGENLPYLDIAFMRSVFKSVCSRPASVRGPGMTHENQLIFDELKKFHDTHYLPSRVLGDISSYQNLHAIIEYSSKEYITSIENNVKLHFGKYVRRYIAAEYPNLAKRIYSAILQDIMIPREEKRCPNEYQIFVDNCIGTIVPEANTMHMGSV